MISIFHLLFYFSALNVAYFYQVLMYHDQIFIWVFCLTCDLEMVYWILSIPDMFPTVRWPIVQLDSVLVIVHGGLWLENLGSHTCMNLSLTWWIHTCMLSSVFEAYHGHLPKLNPFGQFLGHGLTLDWNKDTKSKFSMEKNHLKLQ